MAAGLDEAHGQALATHVAALLEGTRARTLGLVAGLPPDALVRAHSPLMSPLVWDLGHIGQVEEAWLLRALGVRPRAALPSHRAALYEPLLHPRAHRAQLALLGPAQVQAYLAEVRAQVLEQLAAERFPEEDPLRARAFVHGMVLQHEQQHVETMLATLSLMESPRLLPAAPPRPHVRVDRRALPGERRLPGGAFRMGTDDAPWALDNERPAHRRALAPFFLDTFPVTNAEYQAFIDDGGYQRPALWSAEGWAHRVEAGLELPLFWTREGPRFFRRRFGHDEEVPPDEPVMHVCFHEAEAYARWAGKRLPTEAEWEYAASWDAAAGRKRAWPWAGAEADGGGAGAWAARANLAGRHWGPLAVGALPEGQTPEGVWGLFGDVWEWTASAFAPYPGFVAFPYRGYSAPFFDGRYRVLRGGSWATHPLALRPTFRNWDFPIRRQIFAGFRCARDALPEETP